MEKIKAMVTQVLDAPDVVPGLAKYIAGYTGKKEKDVLKSITSLTGDLKGKEFIRKFYSAEKIEVVEEERSVIGIINTSSKDRDREVVDPDGAVLTDYQHNRVVLYAHDYSGLPIGRNMWIKNKPGVGLIAKTEFAKRPADLPEVQPWLADQVYHLMKEGYLNGFSIGFIPLEERKLSDIETKSGVERAWSKWLMLEYSIVAVPSNPEAIAMEVKSGSITHPQLISDLEIEIEEEKMETKAEEKEVFNCECIDCGHKMESDQHCKDLKCPECGGEMRRADRPGPGTRSYSITEDGSITATVTEGEVDYHFDTTLICEEDQKTWSASYGEQVKDILTDEVLKGEDGEIDQALLKSAIAGLNIITTSGDEADSFEIEITDEETKGAPEDEEQEEDAGEGEGEEIKEEEAPPVEADPEDKTAGEGVVKTQEDVIIGALLTEIKSIKEEITQIKEGRVLSKSTRNLIEQAVDALNDVLEKADIKPAEEAPEEIEEKNIDLVLDKEEKCDMLENESLPETTITREQIKDLLSTPEAKEYIKSLMDKSSGKM